MRALLSVDPGVNSAWALYVAQKNRPDLPDAAGMSVGGMLLTRRGRINRPDALDVYALLGELLPTWQGSEMIVEGQWFSGKKGTAHYRSIQMLIESRCAWQDAALLAGASVAVIPPGTWMRQVASGAHGATPGERVRSVCYQVYPEVRPCTLDMAAAIMLGRWRLQRGGGG